MGSKLGRRGGEKTEEQREGGRGGWWAKLGCYGTPLDS